LSTKEKQATNSICWGKEASLGLRLKARLDLKKLSLLKHIEEATVKESLLKIKLS